MSQVTGELLHDSYNCFNFPYDLNFGQLLWQHLQDNQRSKFAYDKKGEADCGKTKRTRLSDAKQLIECVTGKKRYLKWLIEEGFHSLREPSDQSKRVSQNVQAQNQNIHLLEELQQKQNHISTSEVLVSCVTSLRRSRGILVSVLVIKCFTLCWFLL